MLGEDHGEEEHFWNCVRGEKYEGDGEGKSEGKGEGSAKSSGMLASVTFAEDAVCLVGMAAPLRDPAIVGDLGVEALEEAWQATGSKFNLTKI